jgi:hypothetical protein
MEENLETSASLNVTLQRNILIIESELIKFLEALN